MSTTYVLRNTTSDLSGGDSFSLLLRQAPIGAASMGVSVNASATGDSYGFTAAGDPSDLGLTGTYTVTVNVTTGNTRLQLSIGLQRISNSGVVQQSSGFTLEQTATAGIKTFNFPSTALGTWTSGDRLRVTYRFRNTFTMAQTCVIEVNTANTVVVAPWTLPIIGDDYTFHDICGFVISVNNISRIDKWSDVGTPVYQHQLNTTNDTALSQTWFGINKFQRGYNNNNKLFYVYTPWRGGGGGQLTTRRFGWIAIDTGAETVLTTVSEQIATVYYGSEFFGVDRNDNIIYMTSLTPPPGGAPASNAQGIYYRLLKIDGSTGAILSDVKVARPQNGPYSTSDYGWDSCTSPTTFTCVNTDLNKWNWLSSDGQYIYGYAEVLPNGPRQIGAPCEGGSSIGCYPFSQGYGTWETFRINVASGAVTLGLSTFSPMDTSDGLLLTPDTLRGQPLRLLDGSVWLFPFIVKGSGGSSYVGGYHFSDSGTYLGSAKIGRNTYIASAIESNATLNDKAWTFAADINSAGDTIAARLAWSGDDPLAQLGGESDILSAPLPLTETTPFTVKYTDYLLSYAICAWQQIQVNTASRPLVAGMYSQGTAGDALQATLSAGQSISARRPFVTLIGAN
jgi:hypothetical protein